MKLDKNELIDCIERYIKGLRGNVHVLMMYDDESTKTYINGEFFATTTGNKVTDFAYRVFPDVQSSSVRSISTWATAVDGKVVYKPEIAGWSRALTDDELDHIFEAFAEVGQSTAIPESCDFFFNGTGAYVDTDAIPDEIIRNDIVYKREQQRAKGDDKVPFPEMDEIATHEDENGAHLSVSIEQWLDHVIYKFIENISIKEEYEIAKTAYENGAKVTWRLKDKHADIKAEYAAAKEAEKNGGYIVKVFRRRSAHDTWKEVKSCEEYLFDQPDYEYKLRYYRIKWEKVLAWSYANGVFVECEFSWYQDFKQDIYKGNLYGYDNHSEMFATTATDECIAHCRLAPGVEIQDEWLEEVTDDSSTL